MKVPRINVMKKMEARLFSSMVGNYQSESEREFFEKMLYKQQWELSMSNGPVGVRQ